MAKIDFGSLTRDETVELAVECMNWLPLEERVTVVLATFAEGDERVELAAWLGGDDSDPC